jgi:dihydropyrimidinase
VLAQALKTPLYIVHISAKESVEALRYFKGKNPAIYGETCPHYLILQRNPACGILAKVNPPLRDLPDQDRIWAGLGEETLDTIGSDHVVYLREDKEKGIWKAPAGFGAIGATLPLLVSEGIHKGRLTWEQLVRVTSENVAKIFHLFPQKGCLQTGSDADVIIVDPEREWILGADTLQSSADFSVYEGKRVKGKVINTFVRGNMIVDEGRFIAEKPAGEYAKPKM